MKTMLIGSVAKAQGIKGEIKINALTDDESRFLKLKNITIGGEEYAVEGVRLLPNGVFMKLWGVDDRNAAELLRGKNLEVDRTDAVVLPKDRHFIVDLVGCEVFLGDKSVGKLDDIIQNGGCADIYSVKGSKQFMFPALKDVFISIDISAKKIVLDKKRFEEICVYED